MKMEFKNRLTLRPRISGRTGVAVLGLITTAIVAGTLIGARHASAQAPATKTTPVFFGPIGMVEDGGNGVGVVTVKVIMPSLPDPATPAKVEAFTNYTSVSLDIPPGSGDTVHE